MLNVVAIFGTKLGSFVPSLNAENAKECGAREVSLVSKVYVDPLYSVRFGVS